MDTSSSSSSDDDAPPPAPRPVPADLAHIARLLGGGEGGGGTDTLHPPPACARRPGRRRRGGAAAGAAGAAAQPPAARPRPPPPVPRHGNDDDAHARPGPRSTPTAAHCTACDCWVNVSRGDNSAAAGRPAPSARSAPPPHHPSPAWAAHVAGIRHRRTVLSLRLTGGRDALVLSAFEPEPSSSAAARGGGRWAEQRRGGRQQWRSPAGAGAGAAADDDEKGSPFLPPPTLAALHTAALKELVAHSGVADAHARLAERLSRDRLAAAAARVEAAFGVAAAAAPAGQGTEVPRRVVLPGATPAVIAAAAAAVRVSCPGGGGWAGGGRPPHPAWPHPPAAAARHLPWSLTVIPCPPHPLDLAAVTAALCLLADTVRAEPAGLVEVVVDAGGWSGRSTAAAAGAGAGAGAGAAVAAGAAAAAPPLPLLTPAHDRGLSALQAPPSSSAPRLWGLVLRGWTAALWSNGTLARLEVAVPGLPAAAAAAASLRAAAAASPAARRLAVACAGHAKGATSPMHVLPLEVLGAIMDVAVPTRVCEVVVVG